MAAEIHPSSETAEAAAPMKRKRNDAKKKKKTATKKKGMHREISGSRPKKVRNSHKMVKLFRKRARDYNSDDGEDDDEDESVPNHGGFSNQADVDEGEEGSAGNSSEGEGEESDLEARGGGGGEKGGSDEEDDGDEIQPGITKFVEGCRAFRVAFMKTMRKNVSDDMLGPVLSGHKKLIVERLAEEEEERKVKGETKKEKHLIAEKGHVKPASFLDTKEKFLISVATKGVVKLFNAVNKAQNAQKGLNPSRSKDAKALGKQRKDAFNSELRKTSDSTSMKAAKGAKSTGSENNGGSTWAPLHDSFMLTNSKLKDWDKMPDPAMSVPDEMALEDSSDDD